MFNVLHDYDVTFIFTVNGKKILIYFGKHGAFHCETAATVSL
jgi:hypothetical protein